MAPAEPQEVKKKKKKKLASSGSPETKLGVCNEVSPERGPKATAGMGGLVATRSLYDWTDARETRHYTRPGTEPTDELSLFIDGFPS